MILLKLFLEPEGFQDSVINQWLLYWPVLPVLFLWQTTHTALEGSKSRITDMERNRPSLLTSRALLLSFSSAEGKLSDQRYRAATAPGPPAALLEPAQLSLMGQGRRDSIGVNWLPRTHCLSVLPTGRRGQGRKRGRKVTTVSEAAGNIIPSTFKSCTTLRLPSCFWLYHFYFLKFSYPSRSTSHRNTCATLPV